MEKIINTFKRKKTTIAVFGLLVVTIISFFFMMQKSRNKYGMREPDVSWKYLKARDDFNKGNYANAALNLSAVIAAHEKAEDVPRSTYLLAQTYRKLAERAYKEDEKAEDNYYIIPEFTRASTYLHKAMSYYQKIVNDFPQHFLADDALRWLAGCFFSQGKFLQAMRTYIEVAEKYPQGDQTRALSGDLRMIFDSVLSQWKDLPSGDRMEFMRLLQSKSIAIYPWLFPQDSWQMFNRAEAQELCKVLVMQNKIEQFLWTASFSSHVGSLFPLEDGLKDWLSGFMKHCFYNGRFDLSESASMLLFQKGDAETKKDVETFFWCSLLMNKGPAQAFELCIKNEIHNGMVAIAYNWLSKEQLAEFLDKNKTSLAPNLREMFLYILAMENIADQQYENALNLLFEVANDNGKGGYEDLAWRKILEIIYFLDIPQASFQGISSYEVFKGILGDSVLREGMTHAEMQFWGKEYLSKNTSLLNEIYNEYSMYEKIVWGRNSKKLSFLEDVNLQMNFLDFIYSAITRIKNAPLYDAMPLSSQKSIDALLDIVSNRNKYDFNGVKDRYSRQKIFMSRILVPLIKQWNVDSKEKLKKEILPLLAIIWNLSNIGDVPVKEADRLAYYDYEKGNFFMSNETYFKKDINVFQRSWTPEVVDMVYSLKKPERILFLQGYSYVLSHKYFTLAIQHAENEDLKKKAIFMGAMADEFYAMSLKSAQRQWGQTLDIFSRFVWNKNDHSQMFDSDIATWVPNGVFVPFWNEWSGRMQSAIAQYAMFCNIYPDDKMADDAYLHMGSLYDAQGSTLLAKSAYASAAKLDGDMKENALEASKTVSKQGINFVKDDCFSLELWRRFFAHDYNGILNLIEVNKELWLELRSREPNLLYVCGVSSFYLKNYEKSMECFSRYLFFEPDGKYVVEVLSFLARLPEQLVFDGRAEKIINEYINDEKKWLHLTAYLFFQSNLYERKGDFLNAIGTLSVLKEKYSSLSNLPIVNSELIKKFKKAQRNAEAQSLFDFSKSYAGKHVFDGNEIREVDSLFQLE